MASTWFVAAALGILILLCLGTVIVSVLTGRRIESEQRPESKRVGNDPQDDWDDDPGPWMDPPDQD